MAGAVALILAIALGGKAALLGIRGWLVVPEGVRGCACCGSCCGR